MNSPAGPAGTNTGVTPTPEGGGAPGGAAWEGRPHRSLLTAARLVSFTVLCGLLYWGKSVAIPIALAVLFSFVLNPLVKRLQRRGVPRAAAAGIAVGLACTLVLALGWLIGTQISNLSDELPKRKDNITAKIKQLRNVLKGGAVDKFHETMDNVAHELNDDKPTENKAEGAAETPGKAIREPILPAPAAKDKPQAVYLTTPQNLLELDGFSKLLPFLDPLMTAGLVLVLVVLMLMRWHDMRSRLLSFSGHRNLTVATKACDDAGKRITRYLMMQLLVNSSYGVTCGVGFYLLGLDYAALWGLCAGLFRYVPYAGPTVGALLPIAFSFVMSPDWYQPLWVAGFIIILELISNNAVEPWLYGSNLGLSAMGIIMSAVAWTFLWGPVGLVMSTPLTVCLVVMGEYVPAFAIFTRLFGDKPVMEPHFQFYQRLLAHDESEATDLVRLSVKESGLRESVESVFVPALALAKRDETASLLEKEDANYITATAERIFESFREEAEKSDADEAEATHAVTVMHRASVVLWPLNDFALTAARLLQWMLRDSTADVTVLTPQMLLGEAAAEIREREAVAVCLVNLEGSDMSRTRSFVKRLRMDSPNLPITVARLGVPGTTETEVRDAFKDAGAVSVTRTLTETSAALLPFANDAAKSLPEPQGTPVLA
jgi:predicted PurR-regulated permease PerM